MCQVYLSLGGNLGDRLSNFTIATQHIKEKIGEVLKESSIYETKAWGDENQPDYLNMVLEVSTELEPEEILNETQKIEHQLGRQRSEKWGARTMDIDILFIGDKVLDTERLKIPHPLMSKRKFVLLPLMEVAPEFIHPIFKTSIKTLTSNCEDTLEVKKLHFKNSI